MYIYICILFRYIYIYRYNYIYIYSRVAGRCCKLGHLNPSIVFWLDDRRVDLENLLRLAMSSTGTGESNANSLRSSKLGMELNGFHGKTMRNPSENSRNGT